MNNENTADLNGQLDSGDLFAWTPIPSRTRADQILDSFEMFHAENPEVWTLFCRFALEAVASGAAHYSAHAIIHRIRWHTEIETGDLDGLKINNNFFPYYARMFHLALPEHNGFFRNRKLTTEGKVASLEDRQAFIDEPAGEEKTILARLREILG